MTGTPPATEERKGGRAGQERGRKPEKGREKSFLL